MSSTTTADIRIGVHLDPDDWSTELRQEALAGLTSNLKELSPTWLYDERGCGLFEAITMLPEYYRRGPNGRSSGPGPPR